MPRIAVLPDTLASQVAAGEVVERPASVLKELIENSLDAQATHIEVEVRKGGVALLKVTDNGHGMDRENALLCLERHATSKLQDADGLTAILTHGFRGEALPSIASVARFRLTTNDDPSSPATEVTVEGGTVLNVGEAARAAGTTIEVKDLFYNIPARRKFLKSESTEYAHLEHVVRLSALGNAHVRYTFKNNGRVLWDLKPSTDRRTRIADITGHQTLAQLREVPSYQLNAVAVEGYLLPGRLARGTSRSQTVFINNRPIDDPVIKAAIRDGYQGQIQPGQFPVVWLWITMPPEHIDVNVHPAKREVRFARPSEIKHCLSEAIASALSPQRRPPTAPPTFLQTADTPSDAAPTASVPPASAAPQAESAPATPEGEEPTTSPAVPPAAVAPDFQLTQQWSTPDQQEMPLTATGAPADATTPPAGTTATGAPGFTVIGALHERYWLLQDETGLVILDPIAARARVCYEELKRAYQENSLSSQSLLLPLLLELDPHDQITLKHHLATLHELGVEISCFGGNTYQVQSLPTLLDITESGDAEHFLLGVIDQLERSSSPPRSAAARAQALEQLFITIAAQSAKLQPLSLGAATPLLEALMRCDLPYCTASGSPTMTHYALSDVAKKFQ